MLACCALPSCSDDDDEPSWKSAKDLLIGTWDRRSEWYSGEWIGISYKISEIYTFKKDGTGSLTETYLYADGTKDDDEITTFTWFYDEDTKILTMRYEEDNETYCDDCYISSIDSSTILAYWEWDFQKGYYSNEFVLDRVN
jgi:hypothetical protein